MDARSFPTHPLDESVTTLEQARQVISRLGAWTVIDSREHRREREGEAFGKREASHWESSRLAVIPGLAQADEKGLNARDLVRYRHAEAVALLIEEEKRRWATFPGAAPLQDLVGFTVSRFDNGPDSPPTMSFHAPVFAPPQAGDPQDPEQLQEARVQAFAMLRNAWDRNLPESPLHGMLFILADRTPAQWQADISTPQATLETLLGPALFAKYAAGKMDQELPAAPQAKGAGPRGRL